MKKTFLIGLFVLGGMLGLSQPVFSQEGDLCDNFLKLQANVQNTAYKSSTQTCLEGFVCSQKERVRIA